MSSEFRADITTVEQFVKRLSEHDFFYTLSEDERVWRDGEREWNTLVEAAERLEMSFLIDWYKLYMGRGIWLRDAIDLLEEMKDRGLVENRLRLHSCLVRLYSVISEGK